MHKMIFNNYIKILSFCILYFITNYRKIPPNNVLDICFLVLEQYPRIVLELYFHIWVTTLPEAMFHEWVIFHDILKLLLVICNRTPIRTCPLGRTNPEDPLITTGVQIKIPGGSCKLPNVHLKNVSKGALRCTVGCILAVKNITASLMEHLATFSPCTYPRCID